MLSGGGDHQESRNELAITTYYKNSGGLNMSTKKEFPSLIFTDDAWILNTEPPVSIEDLRQKVVGSYAGTSGGFWWSVGDHEVYNYETEIGERFGEDIKIDSTAYSFVHSSEQGMDERIAKNVRHLLACGGTLQILSELCREVEMPFFPRVRMNSHYVIDPSHPGYGRFRRDHPEWLIGQPGEVLPKYSIEWALRTGLNYAVAAVRDYMEQITCEVFEGFEVDGVEMDFMRHPGYFRMEEAYAQRYLMTDLVQRVKTRLDAVSLARGKPLRLAVRVPPTLADSVRVGLDVETWIKQGLVDIVVVGGGFIAFETPLLEFVEAAAGTNCLIYGCIEATRYCDTLNLRALASRWLRDGAAGIYLYNFFTMVPAWNRQMAKELVDRQVLRRLDKRYETDQVGAFSPTEGHSGGFRYASPEVQMGTGIALQRGYTGPGPVIKLDIADEVEAAQAEGVLEGSTLVLRLQGLTVVDELKVDLNGQTLGWAAAQVSFDGWYRQQIGSLFWTRYPVELEDVHVEGASVVFAVGHPPLVDGINTVEIHLLGEGTACVLVEKVEISICFSK